MNPVPMPEASIPSAQHQGPARQQSSRYLGGGRTSGVRPKRQPVCSREDRLAMRDAFSDFLREHGRVLKPENWRSFQSRSGNIYNRGKARSPKRDWQPSYLAALERTGDPEESCRRAGAVLETVQAEIQRNPTLREKCALAIAKCVARIAERNARKATRLQETA